MLLLSYNKQEMQNVQNQPVKVFLRVYLTETDTVTWVVLGTCQGSMFHTDLDQWSSEC